MIGHWPTKTMILPHIRKRHRPLEPRLLKRQPRLPPGQCLDVFVRTRSLGALERVGFLR